MNILKKIFGTSSEKELKSIYPIVDKIEAMEGEFQALSDEELQAKTQEFKTRYQEGATLDDLLPEAFAACREASWRVLGMKPYRVQMVGGIVLHQGRIAEMKTGEGKTLVATLPAYLNALTGMGCHVITVNDYLAKRDSEWMGKVYRFMGLTVGLVIHGVTSDQKRLAYAADITYGTNNEYGFDYLRDNMAIYKKEMVQRGHVYAIVDEVDSILIDEARTPLIISGQGEKSTELYTLTDNFVAKLTCKKVASVDTKEEEDPNEDADYVVDEKARSVTLTARGIAAAEKHFNLENLSDPENTTISHHINQAIRARGIMMRDVDYVVKDGEVIIVDESTGRLMNGRRYNEGLHQAIEAKEKVKVAHESKTLATVTFQNYFRLYDKLSGMTGTAMTEEDEFNGTYSIDIVEIPTNRGVARIDHPDSVFKNERGKFTAIVRQIKECHEKGQPVLVGTVSIEKSELVSALLKKNGIKHNVLNAKNHEKEAEIVAQAGKLGAITVATNMAGRGTDIMLGGNAEHLAKSDLRKAGLSEEMIIEATGFADTDDEEIKAARKMYSDAEEKHKAAIQPEADKVREVGGLYILGTERHESRRIDNQLRGRAGRQGDPGESRFFLSLEDDIMRLFGSDRVMGMMESLGVEEDMPIEQKMLTNAIENSQKKVESRHFQTRKNVLEYDDVMNTQREVIYGQRRKVLDGEDLQSNILSMIHAHIQNAVDYAMGEVLHLPLEDYVEMTAPFRGVFLPPDTCEFTEEELAKTPQKTLVETLQEKAMAVYKAKEEEYGSETMREIERVMILRVVDEYWMDHIDAMDELRKGIGLRAYGQNNPVVEYKREGYTMFEEMISSIQDETIRRIFLTRVQRKDGQGTVERTRVAKVTGMSGGGDGSVRNQPVVRAGMKIGRNDPCPCGSGKKWKKCDCETYHTEETSS